jgi:acetolactate synthase-1/2/3 large subunit
MKLAVSGRPGPVVLQVPFDVQHELIEVKDMNPQMFTDNINSKPRPNSEAIEKAADLIKKAKRPLIVAGGGVKLSGAFKELQELAETFNIPVATTLMGKGALPENHPLSLGVAGMCGTHTAYTAAGACDVVIGIGCRFNDCHTAQWRMYKIPVQTKLIHIDIDVEEIARNYPTEVGIVADARMALIDLKDALVGLKPLDKNGEWWTQIKKWREEHLAKISDAVNSDWEPVHYARLFNIVTNVANEIDPEMSVLFDTGNSQSFAPTFFNSQSPNISSNGQFAQMGFATPAIIGAKLARPNHPALAISGDGSFLMTTQAVATAAQYNIPVVWVVFNNQSLLMERELMLDAYGRESFCDYFKDPLDFTLKGKKSKGKGEYWNPDLLQLANSLGVEAYRIVKPEEIEAAVRKAITSDKPVVLDVWVNQNTPGWYNIPFYFPNKYKDRGMETPYLPPHNNIYEK